MKIKILLLFVFMKTLGFSQDNDYPCKYPFVSKHIELKCFIEDVSTWMIDGLLVDKYSDNFEKYKIYYINIKELDTAKRHISLSVSYILNRTNLESVDFTNYFKVGKRVLLIKSKDYSEFLETVYGYTRIYNLKVPNEISLKLMDNISEPILSIGYEPTTYYIDYLAETITIKVQH